MRKTKYFSAADLTSAAIEGMGAKINRARAALDKAGGTKTSFPQNFRSSPPILAENRPNGEEVA